MEVITTIEKAENIYIDTALFIYLFEENEAFFAQAKKVFEAAIEQGSIVTNSVIVIAELLSKKEIQTELPVKVLLKNSYYNLPNLKLVSVDRIISEHAADLRATYNIALPDAIHLSTAILEDCQLFVTNDKKLKRVKEIKVFCISDFII